MYRDCVEEFRKDRAIDPRTHLFGDERFFVVECYVQPVGDVGQANDLGRGQRRDASVFRVFRNPQDRKSPNHQRRSDIKAAELKSVASYRTAMRTPKRRPGP